MLGAKSNTASPTPPLLAVQVSGLLHFSPEKRAGVGGGSHLAGTAWWQALVLEQAGIEFT